MARITVTNTPLYTPGDEEAGLAAPGESISFSLWANNDGNVDLHDVRVLPKDGEHELTTNVQRDCAGVRRI